MLGLSMDKEVKSLFLSKSTKLITCETFLFRGFAHLANSILLYALADVGIKCCLNFRIRFMLRDFAGLELRITALAHSDGWEGWFSIPLRNRIQTISDVHVPKVTLATTFG
jgi:hypothetical protein